MRKQKPASYLAIGTLAIYKGMGCLFHGIDKRTSKKCLLLHPFLEQSIPTNTTPPSRRTSFFLHYSRELPIKTSDFRIITLGHIGLGIKYKTWYFSTVFALGGIGEILGYIGRVGSSFDVMSDPFYTIQLVLLALSPGFFSAGLYLTISNLYVPLSLRRFADRRAVIVGPANSFLKPLYYVVIFSTFDVLALVIQSVGGGSAAVKYHRGESTETATHTLVPLPSYCTY